MLTEKQKKLYDFICARVESDGISPSYEEMMDHLGLKSKSGVHRLVSALEERGKIVRLKARARAITPADMVSGPPHHTTALILRIKNLAQRRVDKHMNHNAATQEILALCNQHLGASNAQS